MEKYLKPKTIRERMDQYKKNKDLAINTAISIFNASVEMVQERCEHLNLKIVSGKDYYSCEDCMKHFPDKKCSHKEKMYHSDPSGNNDSYYECLECHREVQSEKFFIPDAHISVNGTRGAFEKSVKSSINKPKLPDPDSPPASGIRIKGG